MPIAPVPATSARSGSVRGNPGVGSFRSRARWPSTIAFSATLMGSSMTATGRSSSGTATR